MFGKRKSPALALLEGAMWRCATCQQEHVGMFDLAASAPDHWGAAKQFEPNSALQLDGDFLSEDFCVIGGEHYLVRCVLEIRVHGLARKFGYGSWSTLSRTNFEKYLDGFDSGQFEDVGPWSGWFSNTIKPLPSSINEPCWVHPQSDRQRPLITLHNEEHELASAQREGISPEGLLEIYAANGHGPALRTN